MTDGLDKLNDEAARYCAAVVPGWEKMPGYMQTLAVGKLVQFTLASFNGDLPDDIELLGAAIHRARNGVGR